MATAEKTKFKSNRLGEALVERGLLRPDHLEAALAEQAHSGRPLGRVLVGNGFVTEETLAETLAEQLGIDFLDLRRLEINVDQVRVLTEL